MHRTGRAPRAAWILAAAIALYVAVRLATVIALGDVFYYGEEMARGTAAKAMLDRLPVAHYQIGHWYYEGGAFTVSHVTALAFLLLGPCLFAHKLVAIAFGAVILAVGFRFTERSFGRGAAIVFALLFTFAPGSFQKLSLLNIGTHFAATLFLLGILDGALRIAIDGELTRRRLVVLGLTCGFGTYFSYQCLPAIAFAGLLVLVTRFRELRLAHVGWAVGAMAVGLVPFWIMWSLAGREVFNIHGQYLFASREEHTEWSAVVSLLGSALTGRSAFDGIAVVAAWIAPIFGAAVVWLRRDGSRAHVRGALLASYLAYFAVVYAASGFHVSAFYHYFMVNRFSLFFVLGGVLAAAGIARAVAAPLPIAARMVGAAIGVVLLASGVVDCGRAIAEGRPGQIAENVRTLRATKGYSYLEYLPYFRSHLPDDPAVELSVALAFDERERRVLAMESAQSYFDAAQPPRDELERLFARLEPERIDAFRAGLGPHLLAESQGDLGRAIDAALAREPEARARDLRAIGHWGPGHYRLLSCLAIPPGFALETQKFLPRLERDADRAAYFRGMGHRVHRVFQLRPDLAAQAIATFPSEVQASLTAGYAEAQAWNRLR